MEINFRDIKPHVRLASAISLDSTYRFSSWIPYDARFFFVTDGIGLIETADGVYEMHVGDALFINSGTEYRIISPESRVTYIFVAFDYVFDAVDENVPLCPDSKERFDPSRMPAPVTFTDTRELNRTLYVRGVEGFIDVAKSVVDEFSHSADMRDIRMSAAMSELIILTIRKHRRESKKKHRNSEKILKYVNNNYHMALTNEEIAEKFHYHPNHLNSIFKAEVGVSLREYITRVRVERAANMLLNTDVSVSEIALACGFYDTPHFIRCFKSVMKITPGRYRASRI